ncbi:hypothetical protein RIF29_19035 [Crotalaria pallida]|uniref:Uncharacterized protein n=1 Tax=Crotalaria pallida TaxID=3830 RepID=A0AAN9F015_CROPI
MEPEIATTASECDPCTLECCEDGAYEAIPGSDFVITRVAFRDNSSKYYINDRLSNFTEVTQKLKGKGVDLDNNRFLILQGEVEQISLMKPKAQYLEDIIVVLPQDVKNEAEAYMLKELSLLKWREKATRLALDDTRGKMDEVQGNDSTLEENLKAERDKIKENKQTLKDLEITHNNYMKRQEELENDMRKCKEEFKEYERQDVKYQEDYKHLILIKKLEEKVEKVVMVLPCWRMFYYIPYTMYVNEADILCSVAVETERHRSELSKVRAELEPWEKQMIEHKGKLDVACM